MKKSLLAVFFFLFNNSAVHAQDYPDFGLPSKEELALKECSFDKDAGAVVLMNEAFSYSEDNLQLITTHHVRIKILKQSGIKAANITIPFYRIDYFERIIHLEAVTINVGDDGKISAQQVSKKSFYTTKINDILGQINFTFPEVKPGSIVEYQYQSIMKSYWGLSDWYFQEEIPVIASRYHLKMISDKLFNYQVIKNEGMQVTVLPETNKIFFEMRDIPGLSSSSEPYMDAKSDNIQRVNIQIGDYNSRWSSGQIGTLHSTWPMLNSRLLFQKGLGLQIMATISGVDSLLEKVKSLPSEMEKMTTIYDYVRSNMNWNNIYRKFSADGVNDAWQKHTGSSGDINMILINLLNKAKLKVYPLLVSQRFNGKVDTTYAYADQFNSVFACVEIKGRRYIIDGTDKYTPVNYFPESILNTTTFLIDRLSGELINVTADEMSFQLHIDLDAQVTNDGLIKGNAVINNQGYAAIMKYREYEKDTAKFRDRYVQQKDNTLEISSFSLQHTTIDSLPLVEKFDFSSNLNGTGDYKFIPTNLFTELEKNPFISDKRFSDINFGYNRNINFTAVIKIPEGFIVDGLPANLTLAFPEKDINLSRQFNFNKSTNTINYTLKIDFNKNLYKASEYSLLKDRYKKIFNLLEEKIVLKKKL